jgi:hypothetical protein
MVMSKSTIVDHIKVPYDERFIGLLINKIQSASYVVSKDGAELSISSMNSEFRKFLISKGFEVKKIDKPRLKGTPSIDGIKVKIDKNYNKNGDLRELIINIPAASLDDLAENRKTIINWIEKIVPDIEIDKSIHSRYVRC